jgi:uncharacterized protein (TIGR03437 family)
LNELFRGLNSRAWLLDLGCGKGSFSYRECRSRIVALDSAFADVAPATLQKTEGRVHCVVGNGAELPLASGSMDLVIANHVFEHVEQPRHVAREISRVLKPSGVLFASIPDGFSFADNLYRWWTGGGGHIQRYTFRGFQEAIETDTDLALLSASRLYTSFSFLNPDPRAEGHIAPRSQSLKHLPRLARAGVIAGVNVLSRAVDSAMGTRLSLYGWAFCFGKPAAVLSSVQTEENLNVCGFCGCGHSTGWLIHSGKVRRRLGLRTFLCEACGCRNLFFGMGYHRRIVGRGLEEEEMERPSVSSLPSEASEKERGSGPHIEGISTPFGPAFELAPGMPVEIIGENFSTVTERSERRNWPLELAGVQLLVNGASIPLFQVSPNGIVAHLPFSIPRGLISFAVVTREHRSPAYRSRLSLTAPLLPTQNKTGNGPGEFYHHDSGKPVTMKNPARPGQFVTFRAIGLGPIVPPVSAGQSAPSDPLSRTIRRAIVRIGDQIAPVEYSGLAPDTVGSYQINIQIPRGIPHGENPFILEIGGRRSNIVTISI